MRFVKNTIVVVFALLFLGSLIRNIFSYLDKRNFYSEIEQEYREELDTNKKLKSELKKNSNSYLVEKEIRDQLQLLKPNEKTVILPNITISPTPSPTPIKKPYEEWRDLLLRK